MCQRSRECKPMTESEWLACTDVWLLHENGILGTLRLEGDGPIASLSRRKSQLFTIACCRQLRPLMADKLTRWAVEIAERFADGKATLEGLDVARSAVEWTR